MKKVVFLFGLLVFALTSATTSYAQRRGSALAAVPVPGQPATPAAPTPSPAPATPQPAGVPRPTTPATPGAKPEEQLRIVADPATNSLIIYGTVQEFQNIKNILKELDAVPRQVLLDVLVAEVTLNNDQSLGVDYEILQRNTSSIFGRNFGSAGALRTLSSGLFAGAFGTASGVSGVFGGRDVKALVTALQSDSRARILSSPSILASDNHPARIQVGSEEPVATGTITGAVGTVASSTTIQYRNTGRIVTIIPQVNSMGLVNLQILAEVSQRGAQVPIGPDSFPSFDTRQAETAAVIQDGDTLAIGGIIAENKTRDRTGIPYLMDLPVIGRFFGSTSDSVRRTELVMLITPHVIRNRDESRDVTEDFKSKLSAVKNELERLDRERARERAKQPVKPEAVKPDTKPLPSASPVTPAPEALRPAPPRAPAISTPSVAPANPPSAPQQQALLTIPKSNASADPPNYTPAEIQTTSVAETASSPEQAESNSGETDAVGTLLNAIEADHPVGAITTPTKDQALKPVPVWFVQVASFTNEKDAQLMANKLRTKGYDASVVSVEIAGKIWNRVEVGHLANRNDARELQKNLKATEKIEQSIVASR